MEDVFKDAVGDLEVATYFSEVFFSQVEQIALALLPLGISRSKGKQVILAMLTGDQAAYDAFVQLTSISEVEMTDLLSVLHNCDGEDFKSILAAFQRRVEKMKVSQAATPGVVRMQLVG